MPPATRRAASRCHGPGAETLIWLVDIAGYTREEAATTVKATANALLTAAIHTN